MIFKRVIFFLLAVSTFLTTARTRSISQQEFQQKIEELAQDTHAKKAFGHLLIYLSKNPGKIACTQNEFKEAIAKVSHSKVYPTFKWLVDNYPDLNNLNHPRRHGETDGYTLIGWFAHREEPDNLKMAINAGLNPNVRINGKNVFQILKDKNTFLQKTFSKAYKEYLEKKAWSRAVRKHPELKNWIAEKVTHIPAAPPPPPPLIPTKPAEHKRPIKGPSSEDLKSGKENLKKAPPKKTKEPEKSKVPTLQEIKEGKAKLKKTEGPKKAAAKQTPHLSGKPTPEELQAAIGKLKPATQK